MAYGKVNLDGLSFISLPVSIAPRQHKYYGTRIIDANGEDVIRLWTAEGEPSEREKQYFGENWTPEVWADYACDSHWECARDYLFAEYLVRLLNATMIPTHEKTGIGIKRDGFQSPDISELDQ